MAKSNLLNGMLLGAGVMYLLDPDKGRRRRAMLTDQLGATLRRLNEGLDTSVRDLSHRSYGVYAEARGHLRSSAADDRVIEARVRSRLGRIVSHPGSIDVTASDGEVTLSGPVLARELDGLLHSVSSVAGVRGVTNRLDVHQSTEGVPGLQGQGRRPGDSLDVMQENWSPATRLLASLTGGSLTLYGLRARGVSGSVLGTLGLGLLARALSNLGTRRLVGMHDGRRAIDIIKTVNVDAPLEEVFEFWSRFENFPRFMEHLREVRRIDHELSEWVAAGPGGLPIEWRALITEWVPNEVIGWKSVPGSPVGNAGVVRFQPNERGGTRVDIRMTYNPPAGALGHVVASFFGADPKHAMDEDLVRFKSLIEQGKTSAHGREVRSAEAAGVGSPDGVPSA